MLNISGMDETSRGIIDAATVGAEYDIETVNGNYIGYFGGFMVDGLLAMSGGCYLFFRMIDEEQFKGLWSCDVIRIAERHS